MSNKSLEEPWKIREHLQRGVGGRKNKNLNLYLGISKAEGGLNFSEMYELQITFQPLLKIA